MYCNKIENSRLRGDNKAAGAELRKLRNALGATMSELAKMLGKKHYTSVAYWESGRQGIPESVMILLRIIENNRLVANKKSRKKSKKGLHSI